MTFWAAVRNWCHSAHVRIFLSIPTLLAVALCRGFRRKRRTSLSSILLTRLDGLGDCVMTLPLLDQLNYQFPEARITVVTLSPAKPIFEASPSVHEVLVLHPLPYTQLTYFKYLCGALALYWRSLRGRYFDMAINPRWDMDQTFATMLCSLTRAPETVGYQDNTSQKKSVWNRGFQSAWNVLLPPGPLQHEVLRNLAVGRAVGCAESFGPPRIIITPKQHQASVAWLGVQSGKFIAVGLSAGHAMRRWSAESYVQTLQILRPHLSAVPVLFCDEATQAAADQIIAEIPYARLARSFPLMETAALLSECSLFVGSDSGLGHVAAAVGCPTVTISPHPSGGNPGHANSPARFHPFGNDSIVVQPKEPRLGCIEGCQSTVPHCILDVTPEDVAIGVLRLLRIPL